MTQQYTNQANYDMLISALCHLEIEWYASKQKYDPKSISSVYAQIGGRKVRFSDHPHFNGGTRPDVLVKSVKHPSFHYWVDTLAEIRAGRMPYFDVQAYKRQMESLSRHRRNCKYEKERHRPNSIGFVSEQEKKSFTQNIDMTTVKNKCSCMNWKGKRDSENRPIFNDKPARNLLYSHYFKRPMEDDSDFLKPECNNMDCVNCYHMSETTEGGRKVNPTYLS